MSPHKTNQPTAIEVLQRLIEGNQRFVDGKSSLTEKRLEAQRQRLIGGQSPLAVILGCADSRVPAEIIFDQGLGELFVLRIAGNIVAASHIGSVEFATESFGTPLVIVLGHEQCGAVSTTLKTLQEGTGIVSPNLRFIVHSITPSVEPLLKDPNTSSIDQVELLDLAVKSNICLSVKKLKEGSDIIRSLVENEQLLIVGAKYSLTTGKVNFFHGMPERT